MCQQKLRGGWLGPWDEKKGWIWFGSGIFYPYFIQASNYFTIFETGCSILLLIKSNRENQSEGK